MKSVLSALLVGLGLLLALHSSEARRRRPHQNQVVNGTPAENNEFPFLVHIDIFNLDMKGLTQMKCTGTILDGWHILTAAKCLKVKPFDEEDSELVNPGQVYFKYGCLDLNFCRVANIGVTKIWAYKNGSTPVGSLHDIAVLRTDEMIIYNWRESNNQRPLVSPVHFDCGIKVNNCPNKIAGEKMLFAGWGNSDPQTIVMHQTKANILVNRYRACYLDPFFDRNFMLCAGGEDHVLCKNYGAPLVRYVKQLDGYFQEGIMSLASPHCNGSRAAIFTKIRPYTSWIKSCILEKSQCVAEFAQNDSVFRWPREKS